VDIPGHGRLGLDPLELDMQRPGREIRSITTKLGYAQETRTRRCALGHALSAVAGGGGGSGEVLLASFLGDSVDDDQGSHLELGRFLRARRERIRPEMVGFPAAGRRRTPGLRREEVAVLAGVSTTWYTYLEQGRGKEVSPAVLDSVARVLQLSEDERRHLHVLAYGDILTRQPLIGDLPGDELVKLLVKAADSSPYPVYGANFYLDLIAWNPAAVVWYDDFSKLVPAERNIMRWAITSPLARERIVDWEGSIREGIARWRAMTPEKTGDSRLLRLVREYSQLSKEFASWWRDYEVLEHRAAVRELRHPRYGPQRLRIIVVESSEFTPSFVVFHVPD